MKSEKEHLAIFAHRFLQSYRLLHFIACRVLGDEVRAAIAIHNCWRIASRNVPHLEYDGAFRSWLVRVRIDEALAIRRESQEERETAAAVVNAVSVPDSTLFCSTPRLATRRLATRRLRKLFGSDDVSRRTSGLSGVGRRRNVNADGIFAEMTPCPCASTTSPSHISRSDAHRTGPIWKSYAGTSRKPQSAARAISDRPKRTRHLGGRRSA